MTATVDMHENPAAAQAAVSALLHGLEADWNRGDMEAYLAAYRRDAALTLVFSNVHHHGWDTMAALYRQTYPDPLAMGSFRVHEARLRVIERHAVLVVGSFSHRFPALLVEGAYSQLWQWRAEDGWKIAHEHTSRRNVPA
jgi:ketosteroid isomerase-like protein